MTAALGQRMADGAEGIDLAAAQRASEVLGSRGILDEDETDELSHFLESVEGLGINDDDLAADLRRHIASSSQSLIDEQLESHAPRFLYFGPRESELMDEYQVQSLESVGQHPALENLAQLVDLDLRRLFQFASRGDSAAAVRPVQEANERLMTAFEDVWTQHNVAVALTGDFRNVNNHLQVFVGKPDGEFYKPSDRSAGLRWFVALYAFLRGAHGPMSKPPVLLVDEADIHLHYDAQADLVREMMQQRLTAEVIYTTHSAGCLPADLSNVRVIEPVESGWSEIHNKFWAHSDARISSLIIRMGASSFAFTRSRSAIATEGPSDYLLLPSLLRQHDADWDRKSVQIVPALASVSPSQIAELDREAGRVIYLTDNDEAGRQLHAQLTSEGIDSSRILSLPAAVVEIEDFISKRVLADACGRIADVVGETVKLKPGDIPDTGRGKHLQTLMSDWKQNPTKVDLAEFLLDTDESIIDRGRIGAIGDLHSAITSALA